MKDQIIVADPEKKLAVIKRFLHIIALLQNTRDTQNWNGHSLADLLSLDEKLEPLSDKAIRDYIKKNIREDLGLKVSMSKGARRIMLGAPIGEPMLAELLSFYCLFVATDSSRELILRQLIKRRPGDCLWMLARIYFASLEKKRIEFDYTTNDGRLIHCTMNPYHLVIRNNNLYLYGRRAGQDHTSLLIANRIENLTITNSSFDDKVPPVDEVFRDTLGSFLGRKYDVKIRYSKAVANQMDQFLGILEPDIKSFDNGERFEASFTVSDDLYLCKQLFMYGGNVEILEPKEIRELMISMLKESMGVYS